MILQPPSKEFIKVERSFGRSPEVYGRHVHNDLKLPGSLR